MPRLPLHAGFHITRRSVGDRSTSAVVRPARFGPRGALRFRSCLTRPDQNHGFAACGIDRFNTRTCTGQWATTGPGATRMAISPGPGSPIRSSWSITFVQTLLTMSGQVSYGVRGTTTKILVVAEVPGHCLFFPSFAPFHSRPTLFTNWSTCTSGTHKGRIKWIVLSRWQKWKNRRKNEEKGEREEKERTGRRWQGEERNKSHYRTTTTI